ncbi:hypothetical protein [Corynebacterium durum]|uniref:hypothetical protein n=1 Tax=Corynebacterium durum TaxID=61592 RepID=UPI0012DF7597|nr:hypothetical protein [Corynebacterium durum]
MGARTVRLRDERGYWHLQEQPPSCSFGNVAAVVGVWGSEDGGLSLVGHEAIEL